MTNTKMDTIIDIKNRIESIKNEIPEENIYQKQFLIQNEALNKEEKVFMELKKFEELYTDKNITATIFNQEQKISLIKFEIMKTTNQNKKIAQNIEKDKNVLENLKKVINKKKNIIDKMLYYYKKELNEDLNKLEDLEKISNQDIVKKTKEKTQEHFEEIDISINSLELQKKDFNKEISTINKLLIDIINLDFNL